MGRFDNGWTRKTVVAELMIISPERVSTSLKVHLGQKRLPPHGQKRTVEEITKNFTLPLKESGKRSLAKKVTKKETEVSEKMTRNQHSLDRGQSQKIRFSKFPGSD